MWVLMDTGDRHEVVSNEVILMPDESIRLVLTTAPGGHIVLEVTEEDLTTLGESCTAAAGKLDQARQILKASKN